MARLLLGSYRQALAESRRTGRITRFVVDVTAKGVTKIVPVEGALETLIEKNALDRALDAARERHRVRVAEITQGRES